MENQKIEDHKTNTSNFLNDWQKQKTLADCNRHLLENGVAADVKFVVGIRTDKRRTFNVHKLISSSRSCVFYHMFIVAGKNKVTDIGIETVHVPDVDPRGFDAMLRYIYYDHIDLTKNNVLHILKASEKYKIDILEQKALEYIKTCQVPENICGLLDQAVFYDKKEWINTCLATYKLNPEVALHSASFENISEETLSILLSIEEALCCENVLVEACDRWASAESKRNDTQLSNTASIIEKLSDKTNHYDVTKESISQDSLNGCSGIKFDNAVHSALDVCSSKTIQGTMQDTDKCFTRFTFNNCLPDIPECCDEITNVCIDQDVTNPSDAIAIQSTDQGVTNPYDALPSQSTGRDVTNPCDVIAIQSMDQDVDNYCNVIPIQSTRQDVTNPCDVIPIQNTGHGAAHAYDDSLVQCFGSDAPKAGISSFDEVSISEQCMINIKKSKYDKPTHVQSWAIPIILSGRNLMACSQSGSGKIAAFLIPVISDMLKNCLESRSPSWCPWYQRPQAVIITPTKELAIRVNSQVKKLAYGTMIKSCLYYGERRQLSDTETGAHIIIGTPCMLLDEIQNGSMDLCNVKYFVIVEVSRAMRQEATMLKLVEQSGLPPYDKRLSLMFDSVFVDPIQNQGDYLHINVGHPYSNVQQTVYQVKHNDKRDKLVSILNAVDFERTLVLVERKIQEQYLASNLSLLGFPILPVYKDEEQKDAMSHFLRGTIPLHVATFGTIMDMDIPDVKHVVIYDFPGNIDDYLHGLGKAGRCGKSGKATCFFNPKKDVPLACALIKCLRDAHQEVPDWLIKTAHNSEWDSIEISTKMSKQNLERYKGDTEGKESAQSVEMDINHNEYVKQVECTLANANAPCDEVTGTNTREASLKVDTKFSIHDTQKSPDEITVDGCFQDTTSTTEEITVENTENDFPKVCNKIIIDDIIAPGNSNVCDDITVDSIFHDISKLFSKVRDKITVDSSVHNNSSVLHYTSNLRDKNTIDNSIYDSSKAHDKNTADSVGHDTSKARAMNTIDSIGRDTSKARVMNTIDSIGHDTSKSRVMNTIESIGHDTSKARVMNTIDSIGHDTSKARVMNTIDSIGYDTSKARVMNTIDNIGHDTSKARFMNTIDSIGHNTSKVRVMNSADSIGHDTSKAHEKNTIDSIAHDTSKARDKNTIESDSSKVCGKIVDDSSDQGISKVRDKIAVQGTSKERLIACHDIPVLCTGKNAPKTGISNFEEANISKQCMLNIKMIKYDNPTLFQCWALPIILSERDLMACAQSGSGKIAAFLIPIFSQIINNGWISTSSSLKKGPLAMVICPTKTLALRVNNEANTLACGTLVRSCLIDGGHNTSNRGADITKGAHIIVGTPPSLQKFIPKNNISLAEVKYLVITGADRTLLNKREIKILLEQIGLPTKDRRQTLIFGDTLPDHIQVLGRDLMEDYLFLYVGHSYTNIEQTIQQVPQFDKRETLVSILKGDSYQGKTLVLVEMRFQEACLLSYLSLTQIPSTSVHEYHKTRDKGYRNTIRGKPCVLVSTFEDVIDLHIPDIKHVVIYDVPSALEDYLRGIGKTCRNGNSGKATTFFDPPGDNPQARFLINILQEAQQNVPDWLTEIGDNYDTYQGSAREFESCGYGTRFGRLGDSSGSVEEDW